MDTKKEIDSFLFDIHSDPRFKLFQSFVLNARPVVPLYSPDDSTSVEKWKYQCGLQSGFDFAVSLFKMEVK